MEEDAGGGKQGHHAALMIPEMILRLKFISRKIQKDDSWEAQILANTTVYLQFKMSVIGNCMQKSL